ncbi:MAG: hypothetical protein KJ623_04395, partial [Nanoarchaeota archaeon]|nr:hypothetical protein [Nanoarchaeota archaeon]
MHKVLTLRNLNRLIALSIMLLIVVTPITFAQLDLYGNYKEPYSQQRDPLYNSNAYNQQQYSSLGVYGNSNDLGEAIVVNVQGYEPAVIKSSQIESADLPVYVFLSGQTIGSLMGGNAPESEPFISNPNIRSIVVYPSDYTTQFIRGTPIYVKPNYNSLDLSNLGYLVVMLRQIKDEAKVPEEIVLNMSMKIYFDFMRGFGDVSAVDLSLKEQGDENSWRQSSASQDSFWNKKGFLRLIKVENNRAVIQVYNSQISPLSLFSTTDQGLLENYQNQAYLTMSPGEIRTFTLPGSSAFFKDQVRIKLNDISDPQPEARIRVSSGTGISYKTLTKGMKIADGSNWYIESIYDDAKSTEGTVVIRNAFGDKKVLTASKHNSQIPEITDEFLQSYKNKVCSNFIIIDKNKEAQQIYNELNQPSDELKQKGAEKLICTGINEYEKAISDNLNLNDKVYASIGDAYNELSKYYVNEKDNYINSKALALFYYRKVSTPALVEQKLLNLEKEIYFVSENQYIDDESLSVSLSSIITPSASEKSNVTMIVDGQEKTFSIDDSNNIVHSYTSTVNNQIRTYNWKISYIGPDSVTIQKFENTLPRETLYPSLVIGKEIVYPDENGNEHRFKLLKIESKKRAYVTVIPGGGDTYSTSTFTVHIPIEKREITWTPEQIDQMIKDTNAQIEKLDSYITQLNSIVKTWTSICFVTFALLTVKNALAPDRNKARKDVMPYYDKYCSDEVAKGTFATYDKCMSNSNVAGWVDQSLDAAETKQKAIIECSKKGEECYKDLTYNDESLYPKTLQDSNLKNQLDILKITDPIDSAIWDEYNKVCIEYKSLKNVPDTFIKANNQRCNELVNDIRIQKNAFDSAINANKDEITSITEDKTIDDQRAAVTNFRISYSTAKTYEESVSTNKADLINQIKTKSGLNINSILVQAYSTPELKDDYTLIDKNAKGEITKSNGYKVYTDNNFPGTVTIGNNVYRIFKKDNNLYAALDTIDLTSEGLRTDYAKGATAEFNDKGKPYCIPTTKGNYIRISDFYATGDPSVFDEWNVGPDGLLCTNDDLQITDSIRMRKREGEVTNLARGLNCKEGYPYPRKINGQEFTCSQQSYQKAQQAQQGHCQDVMDPDDCKTLFAVCDPVMCPPSRFNLGGNWNLGPDESVVQTGIIGSLVLGLNNYPEVPVPVCLPGILAGLKNIRSLLRDFVNCLYASKVNHQNIGICDKIRSIGVCELLWREAINMFKLKGGISNIISDQLFGDRESGGEYLQGFNDNINAVSDSVNFFTKEYGSSFFAAYQGRSTAEIGSEICKSAIYGKFSDVGNFVDQLTEPEDPPQFFAQFDEAPWSVQAGRTFTTSYGQQTSQQSMYSVYFHIYAGNIPEFAKTSYAADGIKYAVYLKDDMGHTLPVTTSTPNQIWDTISYKQSKDVSINRLGPLGLTTICAVINGREYCGFGKVTTNFGLNVLNDKLVADEALRKKIDNADECVSDVPITSPSLKSVVLPEEYGILSTGIVRTCSVLEPDKGTGYWQDVGTCGTDAQGRNLGTCWIDTRTIDINQVNLNTEVNQNIILSQESQKLSKEQFAILRAQLFDAQKSQYTLGKLDTKKEEYKKEITTKKDELVKLLNEGETEPFTDEQGNILSVTYNYRQISEYSLDPDSRTKAKRSIGEIYVSIAATISPPVKIIPVTTETPQGVGGQETKTKEAQGICVPKGTTPSTISCSNCGGKFYDPITLLTDICEKVECNALDVYGTDCYQTSGLTNIKSYNFVNGACYTCPTDCSGLKSDECTQCSKCQWSSGKCVIKQETFTKEPVYKNEELTLTSDKPSHLQNYPAFTITQSGEFKDDQTGSLKISTSCGSIEFQQTDVGKAKEIDCSDERIFVFKL